MERVWIARAQLRFCDPYVAGVQLRHRRTWLIVNYDLWFRRALYREEEVAPFPNEGSSLLDSIDSGCDEKRFPEAGVL